MHDRPTPLELIRIANATLAGDVLPNAKPEQLYALRMIANALGIAARELASSDNNAARETLGLDALFSAAQSQHDAQTLHARNRHFAQAIRAGQFESDAAQAVSLREHLTATAHAKLAAAHPKGLPGPVGEAT